MEDRFIAGKTLEQWVRQYPLLEEIIQGREVFWNNPGLDTFETAQRAVPLCQAHITDARHRLRRFAPYIARVFPETRKDQGIIESPLAAIPSMKRCLADATGADIRGKLLLKCDSHLAISGSIKARGGIYEVLKHAEDLAIQHGLISESDDYAVLDSSFFREFFSHYSIAVGSTGNLGLSIGIMGKQLGFRVFVHMSSDAKQWKKDLLRQKGVIVIEHESDYGKAVEEGREQARLDPDMHFIDDEQSEDLFLGYAVAASRLRTQLEDQHIIVDAQHPLFVYLPCGVGGSPGGITFGLKQIFKDNVHCFFAEPTASPCMFLGLMTGLHDRVNIHDFGLSNVTDADGLAVARPSGFVGKALQHMISGVYTVRDETLYILLHMLSDTEHLSLEPSALAGMPGPSMLLNTETGRKYLQESALNRYMPDSTHIVWATGGSMVPTDVMSDYYKKGELFSQKAHPWHRR